MTDVCGDSVTIIPDVRESAILVPVWQRQIGFNSDDSLPVVDEVAFMWRLYCCCLIGIICHVTVS